MPNKNEVQELEDVILYLHGRIETLEQILADNGLYEDYEGPVELEVDITMESEFDDPNMEDWEDYRSDTPDEVIKDYMW